MAKKKVAKTSRKKPTKTKAKPEKYVARRVVPPKQSIVPRMVLATSEKAIPDLDGIVGSEQQNAIWMELLYGTSNVMVNARAGSGKTFTMKHALAMMKHVKRLPRYTNFCAFTRAAGNQLKGELPEGIRVGTIHSLGFSACVYQHERIDGNDEQLEVDPDKADKIAKELIGGGSAWLTRQQKTMVTQIAKLVGLCKNCLIGEVHTEDGQWYYNVAWELLDGLCDRYEVEVHRDDRKKVYELVEQVMERSVQEIKVIDQDDMIWLPVVRNYPIFSADLLVVDEDQDLNACQHAFILRAGKRIAVVGDEYQSIFGFRGSDTKSVPHLRALLGDTMKGLKEFGLTVTRRCPKTHVAYVLANGKVKDFEAHPDAIEGTIDTVEHGYMQLTVDVGDMVICRTNAPLVILAFWLTRNRKLSVRIQGRDIASQLLNFVDMVTGSLRTNDTSIEAFRQALVDDTKRRVAELRVKKADARHQRALHTVTERAIMLGEFARNSTSIVDLRRQITELFVDAKDINRDKFVLLGCVHQLKGLEAERVWVYGPEEMPHPMARQAEDIEQEWNCWYVAHTRSLNAMYLVPLPDRSQADFA